MNMLSLPAAYEASAEKAAWIATARMQFSAGARQSCVICGKWRGLVQAHHVFPLSEQFDAGRVSPDQTFVSLCPNHHAAVHLIIFQMRGKRRGASAAISLLLTESYENGEMQMLLDLAVGKVPSRESKE